MAKVSRLTRTAVAIGGALGTAQSKARKTRAAAKKKQKELQKKMRAVAKELKKAQQALERAIAKARR